jgi:interferon gamma-inducible protein 30
LGRGYELLMAEKTNKLNPPKKDVPWITINGQHTEDIQTKAESHLLKLVCDTYTVCVDIYICEKLTNCYFFILLFIGNQT